MLNSRTDMLTKSTPPAGQILNNAVAPSEIIDSKRLMYFFHVARMRSFSAAEAILGVAQPALSRQIQQLEADLGVKLLIRNGRGVTLTDYGTILQQQAQVILGDMSGALAEIQAARRKTSGQISIAAPAGIMAYFMPDILQRYVAAFPEVRVTALQAATGEVYDHLASGSVDVAIIMQPRSTQKLSSQKLLVEPLRLIVRKEHPIAKQPFVERAQLAKLALMLPASRHGQRDNIEEYCAAGDIQVDSSLYIDSVPLMKALVLSSEVAAFLPQITCERDLDPRLYVSLPLKPTLTRTLYVASLQARSKLPFVKALIREVVSVFREKGESSENKD
jgi:DNA-binding transcriptional LysR family regulator